MPSSLQHAPASPIAAILALLIVSVVMLGALFAGVAPHPPATTPLFGMGPFLGGSLALGASAGWLAVRDNGAWPVLAVAFAVTGLISFGPQKYLDATFSEIWPAVIVAQAAIAVILTASIRTLLHGRRQDSKA